MENIVVEEKVKSKRGRKSKAELMKIMAEKLEQGIVVEEVKKEKKVKPPKMEKIKKVKKIENHILVDSIQEGIQEGTKEGVQEVIQEVIQEVVQEGLQEVLQEPEHVAKKRGRKPKGGKIILQNIHHVDKKEEKQNIILHLKCHLKDLNPEENDGDNNLESFCFSSGKNDLSYDVIYKAEIIDNEMYTPISSSHISSLPQESGAIDSKSDTKEIWRKLKILEKSLHLNDLTDKKSACFWCTYDFDNSPIHIPKFHMKDSYHVYGSFCSPECAVAHLMSENIDTSAKFERYHLMNHIYSKIYDYKKSIKPAPNPHYMLERYYGNLTIQEYRALLKSERLFLVVDKPLTRVLPELHEDNDEFIINNKIIPSSNQVQVKKILRKPANKSAILQEHFGMSS
jgi:histone H3/H4